MSSIAYIFLPDIPFINEAKSKEEISSALNQKYPAAKFDPSNIIISKKESKHNAYAQTTQEHKQKLLSAKSVNIGSKSVLLKECFPNHQIYINKLPQSFTKDQISNYFSQFGKIVDVQLFPFEGSYENSKQKPTIVHCYIRFEKNEDAEKCLFLQKKHTIKNKDDIRVVRAYKIGQNDETDKRLFLKITPIVQFDELKLQKQLYAQFIKFGQLREKIRIQQLTNMSSKAIITFTSIEAGQNALQNFKKTSLYQYTLVLRPWASKQSYVNSTAYVGGLKSDVSQELLKKTLSNYGKIVGVSISRSKKPGISNASVTFSKEQSFKLALVDYKNNQQFAELFVGKPYMDIHMNASLRNDFNNFKKKDKKPAENNFSNMGGMGGIGMGYGVPQRFNQPPQFLGGNQQFGMNPMSQVNPQMVGQGQNPFFMGGTKLTSPPNNFKQL